MAPQLQFPPAVVIAPTAMIIIKKGGVPFTVGLPGGPISLNPDGSSYKFIAHIINQDGKSVQTFEAGFSIGGSFSGNYDTNTRQPIYNGVFEGLGLGSAQVSLICPSDTFNGFSNQSLIRTNLEIPGFGLIDSISANYLGLTVC